MTKHLPNPKVDFYFNKETKWQKEIQKLRTIVLDSNLTEELKWGVPTYTLNQQNIVLIHTFKGYCALLFMKGVLINDNHHILIQQTENVQSARQIRFTSLEEIIGQDKAIREYIQEAIEIEASGKEVEFKKTEEFAMPEEFRSQLENHPHLKEAFESLTPGRQRGYLLYFAGAKQAKTRESRIEKYIDHILNGKGIDD